MGVSAKKRAAHLTALMEQLLCAGHCSRGWCAAAHTGRSLGGEEAAGSGEWEGVVGDRKPFQKVWLTLEALCVLLGGHLPSLSKSGLGLGLPQGHPGFPSGSPGPGSLVTSFQAGLGLERGGWFCQAEARAQICQRSGLFKRNQKSRSDKTA